MHNIVKVKILEIDKTAQLIKIAVDTKRLDINVKKIWVVQ